VAEIPFLTRNHLIFAVNVAIGLAIAPPNGAVVGTCSVGAKLLRGPPESPMPEPCSDPPSHTFPLRPAPPASSGRFAGRAPLDSNRLLKWRHSSPYSKTQAR